MQTLKGCLKDPAHRLLCAYNLSPGNVTGNTNKHCHCTLWFILSSPKVLFRPMLQAFIDNENTQKSAPPWTVPPSAILAAECLHVMLLHCYTEFHQIYHIVNLTSQNKWCRTHMHLIFPLQHTYISSVVIPALLWVIYVTLLSICPHAEEWSINDWCDGYKFHRLIYLS